MIHHVVLFRFRSDVEEGAIDGVFADLAGLGARIPGIISYAGGPYFSHEGLNKGYTHGFVMGFEDAESRDAYLPHPEHERVKAKILAILDGGLDGVLAFDFGI